MVSPKSHGPVRADITGDDVGQSYIKKCGYNLTPLREQQKIQYIMWLTHWEKAYHLFVFRYYDPIIYIYINIFAQHGKPPARSRLSARRTKSSQYLRGDAASCTCCTFTSYIGRVGSTYFRQDSEMAIYSWAHSKSCSEASSQAQERNPDKLSAKSHCLIQVLYVLQFKIIITDCATKVKLTVHRQNCKQMIMVTKCHTIFSTRSRCGRLPSHSWPSQIFRCRSKQIRRTGGDQLVATAGWPANLLLKVQISKNVSPISQPWLCLCQYHRLSDLGGLFKTKRGRAWSQMVIAAGPDIDQTWSNTLAELIFQFLCHFAS